MKISRIKEFKNFCLAAAILVAGALLASCSSSDDIAENNQQPVENPTAPKVYTMTIQASKGDGATTRALTLSGHTLKATWDAGEKVKVYQNGTEIGELTAAASDNASTTLTGSFDSAPSKDFDLTFYFHTNVTPSYNSGQDGTLAKIASTYDFCAPATVTKDKFTVDGDEITVPDGISFGANQQAIIKFTLLDKANDAAISPLALTVTDGTSTVELTGIPAATYTANGANNVLYVAFPAAGSAKTVKLTATVVDGNATSTYTYEKSGVTFTNGNYYEIAVKLTMRYNNTVEINTYTESESIAVPTGEHWLIKGTGETSKQITIGEDATVTLDGVNISCVSKYCIKCEGSATIILADGSENSLTCSVNNISEDETYPALWAGMSGTKLTVKGETTGDGSLTVLSGVRCAGIGGGFNKYKDNNVKNCGDIEIEGGVITATGGEYAAGIGSDNGGTCEAITIKGGTITATGGVGAAGIGSGDGGTCEAITIKGGTITATGGVGAAGIGSGDGGSCGNITINGGTITATGGDDAAGIGSGYNGSCGTITIASTVSSVTATKGNSAPNSIGAGAGEEASCGTVTIDDMSGATTSSTFSHFDSVVSNNDNTWTLTHKNP